MAAPLVLTAVLNPSEVDDQVHCLGIAWKYPLELYELAEKREHSSKVNVLNVKQLQLYLYDCGWSLNM